ncbi:MAG: helix-turn-helix domain-containing protein [Candidatus Doudnabacteria bacterium]|nr:helix-turn-helix domain-containing protein [Candidatus Doudnabacteria bacterium]
MHDRNRFRNQNKKQLEMTEIGSNFELLSLKDASDLTPYCADYLNLLARKGKIQARKIGQDWLIAKSDLFSYLRRQHLESRHQLKQIPNFTI